MRFLRLFVTSAAVLAFGAGCGQKGPLYLHDKPPPGVKPPKPPVAKPVPYPEETEKQ